MKNLGTYSDGRGAACSPQTSSARGSCNTSRIPGSGYTSCRSTWTKGMVGPASACRIAEDIVQSLGLFPLQYPAEDFAAWCLGSPLRALRAFAVQVRDIGKFGGVGTREKRETVVVV